MTYKHYSNDWAKTKSRELVRDMIQKTLLTFRRPKDLHVLCLPGIDAQEIFEVYDILGIPRKNITGVEINRKIAREISAKNLGITVVPQSVEEYVANQRSLDFDVVSLDYTGPISNDNVDVIRELRRKQQVNSFIFHQANLIRRDHNSAYLYGFGSLHQDIQSHLQGGFNGQEPLTYEELLKAFGQICKKHNDLVAKIHNHSSIQDKKDLAFTCQLTSQFESVDNSSNLRILRWLSRRNYEQNLSDAENELTKLFGLPYKLDLTKEKGSPSDCIASHFLSTLLIDMFVEACSRYCFDVGYKTFNLEKIIDPQSVFFALRMASNESGKVFMRAGQSRYSYISESGSPMIGDIYFLRHPAIIIKKAEEVTRAIGFPDSFNIKEIFPFARAINEFYELIEKNYPLFHSHRNIVSTDSERIYFGNSSRPVLTKKRFIEELEAGKSVKSIKAEYRGWEKKPLPAWYSHFKMGTYCSREMLEEAQEDSDLEKITREQAIDLLSSGIPVKEIYAAYPTSFSMGTLRAYKAHITMNAREEIQCQRLSS
jgi:hypothetical protein